MGYRLISKNTTLFEGKEFTDAYGNNKVTVITTFAASDGQKYVAFESAWTAPRVMSEDSFRESHYEKSVHNLKKGDLFFIEGEGAKGAYFIVTDDNGDKLTGVIRIGKDADGTYRSHTATASINSYVDLLADGDYGKIRHIRNLDTYGIKLEEDNS